MTAYEIIMIIIGILGLLVTLFGIIIRFLIDLINAKK